DVADLDVVVVGELDAAFEAGLDFLDVVLEAFERLDREVFGDDRPAAGEADATAALNVAVGDQTAGDVADLADLDDGADLGVAVQLLADFRLEHPRQGLFQVV